MSIIQKNSDKNHAIDKNSLIFKKSTLILTRKIGEGIILGPNAEIEITILSNINGQTRIQVEAPKNCPIWRDEIYKNHLTHYQKEKKLKE
mgnify:CR=1 FL=1